MDIHRCRFVPYPPSTINSLAFSHPSNLSQKAPASLRLAIGRENGDIEIWNPNDGSWFQERIFRSGVGRNVEQVVWTQDVVVEDADAENVRLNEGQLRLFSSGGSTSLTEWDLERGTPKRHADGNFGDIWCVAVQPQWNLRLPKQLSATAVAAAPAQLIAAGCADGTILLFSTSDDDLRYEKVLAQPPKKNSRVISLTWRDRHTVVAGYDESFIRVISVPERRLLKTMTLGKGADNAHSLVWAVACLPNGNILSGDSAGELKIWDATNYSLIQRFKTHDADILDIATSADGRTIYTCGIDRRTVTYTLLDSQSKSQAPRWQRLMHRRYHQHDVKVLSAYESKDLSVVVSGGIDTVPVVMPIRNWHQEYHRRLPHLPQKPQLSISTSKRLMLTWWGKELFIWQIPPAASNEESETLINEGSCRRLVGQIVLKDDDSIAAAELSTDGDMIVVSTSERTKLFQLRRHVNYDQTTEIRSRQITLPAALTNFGASLAGFSPDSKWIFAVRLSGLLTMVRITAKGTLQERPQFHERSVKLGRKKRPNGSKTENSLGRYDQTVTCVSFSSDSRILAVGDLSGAVEAWILEGHEQQGQQDDDSVLSSSDDSDEESEDETDTAVINGQKWVRNPIGGQLPRLDSAVLTMSFKPSTASPQAPSQVHGNEGLHPTRNNHHPISPETPSSESGYLTVVTASHQVTEFDVVGGKLSDWSRRKDASRLPSQLGEIKDRVMGMWWECGSSSPRLWLHGTSWLLMMDTTRTQGAIQAKPRGGEISKQRKNNIVEPKGQKRKRHDGAGDMMRNSHKYTATVERAKQTGLMSPISGDEDEEDAELYLDSREQEEQIRADCLLGTDDGGLASWHTTQYRNILGACAMFDNQAKKMEVVVVERPMHDVDLVERFVNGQEW